MLARIPSVAIRSGRVIRPRQPARPLQLQGIRFQSSTSTNTTGSTNSSSGSSHALVGGLAGGTLAFLLGYTWYSFSGTKSLVNSVHSSKSYVENAFKKTTESAPEPSQAVQWLKETVQSYTKLIPGSSKYVDSAFQDIEKIQEKHGNEVNKIIKETYDQLKDATGKGFSMETAMQTWEALQDCFKRIGKLAGSAGQDILDNHPQIKDQLGGRFQELQQMGEKYGPEAKKAVDDTWKQMQDILAGGISGSTIQKLQSLIEEKTQQVQQYGDQAWQKGMEQAKPLLDKQPQLKQLFDENKAKLLQGDLAKLWQKVQEASKSGDTEDLQKFVREQAQKASSSAGGGIEQLFKMIPGGSEIGPKLKQLQELSEKHGDEAEKLIKSAIEDVKKVLSQKVEEGQKLKEKAKTDIKEG